MWLLFFIIGIVIGWISHILINRVGYLVMDLEDDQPFLLELNTHPNSMSHKKYVVLKMKSRK